MGDINLLAIFVTGLLTGGLSCLAVQGGLLASSVAKQTEDDLLNAEKIRHQEEDEIYLRGSQFVIALRTLEDRNLPKKEHHRHVLALKQKYPRRFVEREEMIENVKPHAARPILLFLSSKLVSYTILGALLGALGSMLQLTPYMRAALLLAIGIYMLGLALHLLGAHPIFRHFMLQPPKFISRYIRRKAKSGRDDVVTPTFLGAMTVFIPCGVTTAMMAVAVGTGNPLGGAAVMFAFTIGTTPVFFTLAYTAAKLGAKKQGAFLKFAAIVVLILGLVAIEGGLNLAGSPISVASMKRNLAEMRENKPASNPEATASTAPQSSQKPSTTSEPQPSAQQTPQRAPSTSKPAPGTTQPVSEEKLYMVASTAEYKMVENIAKAGKPYKLEITSVENKSCGRAFTIPSLGIQQLLPEEGVTIIDIPPQKKGTLELMCSMGMYYAEIKFE